MTFLPASTVPGPAAPDRVGQADGVSPHVAALVDAQVQADLVGYEFEATGWGTARQVRAAWVEFLRGRYRTGGVPVRTTEERVGMWLRRIDDAVGEGAICPELCVSSGLAAGDLLRFDQVSPWGRQGPAGGSRALVTAVESPVRMMAREFPDMPVREVIGWVLLACHTRAYDPSEEASAWVRALGLSGSGWAYAAAGLTPGEVGGTVVPFGLPVEQALVMAALRAVPVPVG